MRKAWDYFLSMLQPASLMLVGAVIVTLLFTYRLSSLVPGQTANEISAHNSSQTLRKIVNDPINAPYKVLRYSAQKLHTGIFGERLVSGLIAGFSIILFYMIVRHFCNRYATTLATIMYGTTGSLLTNGRLATANIMLLVLLGLLACGYYLRFNTHRQRSMLITSVILALSLYVPGMLYFIAGGIAWQFKALRRDSKKFNLKFLGICLGVFVLILSPLIYGLVRDPSLYKEYLGLPSKLPNIIDFIKSFLAVPYGIFVAAPKNSIFRLGRQPVLDIFASFMFILGCITLFKRYKLDRLVLLIAIFVVATLYTALSGNYENSFVLLPFIYLCIAIGIGMLLEEWRKVFPLNPLARGVAAAIMALAVVISVNFQTWRYFTAWPHNSETKTVFKLKT